LGEYQEGAETPMARLDPHLEALQEAKVAGSFFPNGDPV